MKKLLRWFWCFIGDHEWTCAAEQGIKPTEEQIAGGVKGFNSYRTTYCKHCKKVSKFSL